MKKKVEFDAHKTVKQPTEVTFKTSNGKTADFVANKKTKVRVHVKFKARVGFLPKAKAEAVSVAFTSVGFKHKKAKRKKK